MLLRMHWKTWTTFTTLNTTYCERIRRTGQRETLHTRCPADNLRKIPASRRFLTVFRHVLFLNAPVHPLEIHIAYYGVLKSTKQTLTNNCLLPLLHSPTENVYKFSARLHQPCEQFHTNFANDVRNIAKLWENVEKLPFPGLSNTAVSAPYTLSRHETPYCVWLFPSAFENFLNLRTTVRSFVKFHTSSSILQKLSTGFYKTSSTMWTTSCIFETLTKCLQRDIYEWAALHITVPCIRLRNIGRTFVNVCEAFSNGGPKNQWRE